MAFQMAPGRRRNNGSQPIDDMTLPSTGCGRTAPSCCRRVGLKKVQSSLNPEPTIGEFRS